MFNLILYTGVLLKSVMDEVRTNLKISINMEVAQVTKLKRREDRESGRSNIPNSTYNEISFRSTPRRPQRLRLPQSNQTF